MDNQPEQAWQAKTQITGKTPKNHVTQRSAKLTPKQQLFIKQLLDNPKAGKAAAYMAAYNHNGKLETAQVEASRTLSKPQVKQALEANSDVFEAVVVQTAKQWGNSDKPRERELALQASYWGHDKVHGKATQRTEQVSTGVTLTIDLTSALDTTLDANSGTTTQK